MMESEYLVHYGVKGMKWGVRKDKIPSTSSKKKPRTQLTKKQKQRIAWTVTGIAISLASAKLARNDRFNAFVGKVLDKLSNKSVSDLNYQTEPVIIDKRTNKVITDFDVDAYLEKINSK